MLEDFLNQVFKKAKDEGAPDSANGLANHIYNELDKILPQPITADSIRGYYRKLEQAEDFDISITAKNHLAQYLGYKDYREYQKQNDQKVNNKRFYYVIGLLVVVIGFLIYENTRKKCMIWDGGKYVKIKCAEAGAKPFSSELFYGLKKIDSFPCKRSFFFDSDGTARVFYHKKSSTELELFTMSTLHPENEKDLNDITEYMIEKYLCEGLE